MSGTVIRVIEDTHYDFGTLEASGSLAQLAAQRIAASQYREGVLLVRIIKINIQSPTTDDIQITVAEDPWDPFSGATLFTPLATTGDVASVPAPLAQTTLNPNNNASPPSDPYALWFPLTTPFGGLLQVAVVGTRASGTPGNSLDVQLNADLILKD